MINRSTGERLATAALPDAAVHRLILGGTGGAKLV
jgi:hypothetical protein